MRPRIAFSDEEMSTFLPFEMASGTITSLHGRGESARGGAREGTRA